MKRNIFAIILSLALCLSLIPETSAMTTTRTGASVSDDGVTLLENGNGGYDLVKITGYESVNATPGWHQIFPEEKAIKVFTYDSSFKYLHTTDIPCELEEPVSVFAGKDYYYFGFKTRNDEENDNNEVLRIVKYTKNWERVGAASLRGNNTIAISSGTGIGLSFAEYNGFLYIRTGHTMYKWHDGLNHQANLTFCIRESDMAIGDVQCSVTNTNTGYVSHSFAQDILVDSESNIVTLDTGDSTPRGAVANRYKSKAGTMNFMGNTESALLVSWPGSYGETNTGGDTQAFAETSQGYIAAVTDSGLGSNCTTSDPMDLYLFFIPKNSFQSESVRKLRITNYTSSKDQCVYDAFLVPTSENGGVLFWATCNRFYSFFDYTKNNHTYFARYYADGSIGDIKKLPDGTLSFPNYGPILNSSGDIILASTPENDPNVRFTVMTEDGSVYVYGSSFTDVKPSDWAYDYVQKAASRGWVNGTGDGKFSPNTVLSYAELAALMTRFAYKDETVNYEKLNPTPWYIAYTDLAKREGLWKGTRIQSSDGLVTSSVNRFEMAQFIYNILSETDALSKVSSGSTQRRIPDYDSIPSDYRTAVQTCYQAEIISGTDDKGTFNGNQTMTRSQAAKVLCTLSDIISPSSENEVTVTFATDYRPTRPSTSTSGVKPDPESSSGQGKDTEFLFRSGETVQTMMDRINAATPAYRSGYLTNGKGISDQNIQEMYQQIISTLPENSEWLSGAEADYRSPGGMTADETTSLAFAVSDAIFGEDAPVEQVPIHSFDDIQVGDVLVGEWDASFVSDVSLRQDGAVTGSVVSMGSIYWEEPLWDLNFPRTVSYRRY